MKTLERERKLIQEYVSEVKTLPKEESKKVRFLLLIDQLFGSKISVKVIEGMEKMVHVYSETKKRRGFMDAYYGDLVIEFEKSLDATLDEAEGQLKKYVSGLWQEEGIPNTYIGIATDGIQWKVYYPSLKDGAEQPWTEDDSELSNVESFALKDEDTDTFYFWLTRLLLREKRLKPTVSAIEEDFGLNSFAFQDAIKSLNAAFEKVEEDPEPRLLFETWAKYLRYTYGSFRPNKELFLKHTYLSALARLLVWAAFSQGEYQGSLKAEIKSVLNGEYFQTQRIENLVEEDFYRWILNSKVESILIPLWTKILNQMMTYDLSLIEKDILKGIYQQLVDENTRHGLGEYYTPDWLCEIIIRKCLPKSGFPKILDPACGSGSFLRAAISHLLKNNLDLKSSEKLRHILDSVMGFDINPLAVVISKTTYALAIRSLIKESRRPVHIPVYLADTLFLPKQIKQPLIQERLIFEYEIDFGDQSVRFPESLVLSPDYYDIAIGCCSKIAYDLSNNAQSETKESLANFLDKEMPEFRRLGEYRETLDSLWEFTDKLSTLIKNEKNSIWAYILKNNYRPTMLANNFDFIIGNPPWLSYRYIEDPKYQEEIKKLGLDKYKVAPKKQKLMTQMEIATIFLIHSLAQFGRDKNSKLAFVMPRSIFSADQHEKFRVGDFEGGISTHEYWDLKNVVPVFNVPACVVFSKKEKIHKSSYPVLEFEGRLKGDNLSWNEARKFMKIKRNRLQMVYLGKHSALSTETTLSKPKTKSIYEKQFRQGATIVPRNLYFVELQGGIEKVDPQGLYLIKTDEEQAKLSKHPYREVRSSGRMEGCFLCHTLLSKDIAPFGLVSTSRVVLPIEPGNKGVFRLLTAKELKDSGYRYAGEWFERAEIVWNEKRGEKADKQNIYERLDYQKELTAQSSNNRHFVLYNAAGSHVAASYFDPVNLDGWFVVEHKVYWCSCSTAEEAFYLLSILNSSVLNKIIKPFQSLGLMGERDIEKKLLSLPIPLFDRRNELHKDLATLGEQAFNEAGKILIQIKAPRSIGKLRSIVRNELASAINEIDKRVQELFHIEWPLFS